MSDEDEWWDPETAAPTAELVAAMRRDANRAALDGHAATAAGYRTVADRLESLAAPVAAVRADQQGPTEAALDTFRQAFRLACQDGWADGDGAMRHYLYAATDGAVEHRARDGASCEVCGATPSGADQPEPERCPTCGALSPDYRGYDTSTERWLFCSDEFHRTAPVFSAAAAPSTPGAPEAPRPETDMTRRAPQTACESCGTGFVDCTEGVMVAGRSCCARCRITDTHNDKPAPPPAVQGAPGPQRICDACGAGGALPAPHTGRVLCDPCSMKLLTGEPLPPVRRMELP